MLSLPKKNLSRASHQVPTGEILLAAAVSATELTKQLVRLPVLGICAVSFHIFGIERSPTATWQFSRVATLIMVS
jgi:hypothetical protein